MKNVLVSLILAFCVVMFGWQQNVLAAAGDVLWKFETGMGYTEGLPVEEQGITTSIAIGDQGTIYFGIKDKHLYALNSNGSLKWRYLTDGIIYSTPSIDNDGTIYFGSYDHYFYALYPDGELKWKYKTNGVIESSAAISSDGTVYFSSDSFYALNSDGSLKWIKNYRVGSSSPIIGLNGDLFFGSDRSFYAITGDGDLLWSFETNGEIKSSAALDRNGNVYFGADDGYVYSLSPDGTLNWKYLTNERVTGAPVIFNDKLVCIGTFDGYLYGIDIDTGNLEWLYRSGQYELNSPVVGKNGIIYSFPWGSYVGLDSNGYVVQNFQRVSRDSWGCTPALSDEGVIYIGSVDGIVTAYDTGYSTGLANGA